MKHFVSHFNDSVKENWASPAITNFGGVTYTNNNDGTFTLNSGTASQNPTLLVLGTVDVKAGTYKLSGCPASGSDTTYRLDVRSGGTVIGGEYGNGVTINISSDSTVSICIRLQQNYTVDNLLFRPMLRQIGDDTFVPYAMSNAELTANILPSAYNAVEAETNAPISILSGGYARIGNLVCVNLKISVTGAISQGDPLVKGLPKPVLEYNTGYGAVSLTNNIGRVFNVVGVGSIAYGDSTSISSGTVILSGMYIAQ